MQSVKPVAATCTHETNDIFKNHFVAGFHPRCAYGSRTLIPGPMLCWHVTQATANCGAASAGCFTAVNQAACPAGSITFQTGSASVPSAWSAANQTAAGNTNSGALLPIATYGAELAGTGKNELWLYWKPVHPLLTVGAAVTDCAGGAAVRRLLQSDTATTSTATYTWTYTLDGQPAGGSQTPVSASTTPKITIQPWALNLANVSSPGASAEHTPAPLQHKVMSHEHHPRTAAITRTSTIATGLCCCHGFDCPPPHLVVHF